MERLDEPVSNKPTVTFRMCIPFEKEVPRGIMNDWYKPALERLPLPCPYNYHDLETSPNRAWSGMLRGDFLLRNA